MSGAAQPILSLRGVTMRFGGIVAADDIGFDVPAGGIFAIIGPNGAGKTTLFNVISGYFPPTAGAVLLEGAEITGLPLHRIAARGLVRTFQLVQLFKDISVADNVRIGFHLRSRGGVWSALLRPGWVRRQEADIDRDAAELLDFVGLGDRAEVPAGELTYGQQRLLELARALAAAPRLLLLDEPAAGLNPIETDRLAETIRRINARGVTVLLIEHDMNLVMRIAQRIVVLDFGRKIAEGPPDEIKANEDVLAAYLGGVELAHA